MPDAAAEKDEFRLRVYARVRPPHMGELGGDSGGHNAVHVLRGDSAGQLTDNSSSSRQPQPQQPASAGGDNDSAVAVRVGSKLYSFDRVFDGTTTNTAVGNTAADPLVDHALSGFNATIMCYGQTGTGKTHTMSHSTTEDVGLLFRSIQRVFSAAAAAQAKDASLRVVLKFTYVQLYRDNLQDLLDTSTPYLKLRRFPDGGAETAASEFPVSDEAVRAPDGPIASTTWSPPLRGYKHFLSLYQQADKNRVVAETKMNKASSRGHSVLALHMAHRHTNSTPAPNSNSRAPAASAAISDEDELSALIAAASPGRSRDRYSRLVFVDLAGYERLKKTSLTDPIRTDEARCINLSLTALANVIHSLTFGAKHVPWRNSKLTQVLQTSLAGNSITSVVLALGPSSAHLTETLNTLHFGHNAIQCKTAVTVNTGSVDYRDAYEKLLGQVERMRAKMNTAGAAEVRVVEREKVVTVVEEREGDTSAVTSQLEEARAAASELQQRCDEQAAYIADTDELIGEVEGETRALQQRCDASEREAAAARRAVDALLPLVVATGSRREWNALPDEVRSYMDLVGAEHAHEGSPTTTTHTMPDDSPQRVGGGSDLQAGKAVRGGGGGGGSVAVSAAAPSWRRSAASPSAARSSVPPSSAPPSTSSSGRSTPSSSSSSSDSADSSASSSSGVSAAVGGDGASSWPSSDDDESLAPPPPPPADDDDGASLSSSEASPSPAPAPSRRGKANRHHHADPSAAGAVGDTSMTADAQRRLLDAEGRLLRWERTEGLDIDSLQRWLRVMGRAAAAVDRGTEGGSSGVGKRVANDTLCSVGDVHRFVSHLAVVGALCHQPRGVPILPATDDKAWWHLTPPYLHRVLRDAAGPAALTPGQCAGLGLPAVAGHPSAAGLFGANVALPLQMAAAGRDFDPTATAGGAGIHRPPLATVAEAAIPYDDAVPRVTSATLSGDCLEGETLFLHVALNAACAPPTLAPSGAAVDLLDGGGGDEGDGADDDFDELGPSAGSGAHVRSTGSTTTTTTTRGTLIRWYRVSFEGGVEHSERAILVAEGCTSYRCATADVGSTLLVEVTPCGRADAEEDSGVLDVPQPSSNSGGGGLFARFDGTSAAPALGETAFPASPRPAAAADSRNGAHRRYRYGPPTMARSAVPVVSLVPHVDSLRIGGDALLGERLIASYAFKGGEEGRSVVRWYRSLDGQRFTQFATSRAPDRTLRASSDILHHYVRVQVTPIRRDGTKGNVVVSKLVYVNTPTEADGELIRRLAQIVSGQQYAVDAEWKLPPLQNGAPEERVPGRLVISRTGMSFNPQMPTAAAASARVVEACKYAPEVTWESAADRHQLYAIVAAGREDSGLAWLETLTSCGGNAPGSDEPPPCHAFDVVPSSWQTREFFVLLYRAVFTLAVPDAARRLMSHGLPPQSPVAKVLPFGSALTTDTVTSEDLSEVHRDLASLFIASRRAANGIGAAEYAGAERPGSDRTALAVLDEVLLAVEEAAGKRLAGGAGGIAAAPRLPLVVPNLPGIFF